ncbi:MAG: hypothetical protein GY952_15675 [Rhodobacteraceae bacterium]|nr:hypothetical protein [Paracoccaceae bacterium]
MLSIEAGDFVNIPNNVLVLIGLSGTGYLAGKVTSGAAGGPPEEAPAAKAARLKTEAVQARQRAEKAEADAAAAAATAETTVPTSVPDPDENA